MTSGYVSVITSTKRRTEGSKMKLFFPMNVKALAHLTESIEGEKARPLLTFAKTIGDLFQSLSKSCGYLVL